MPTPQKWSDVTVDMQSALASATTITGLTNASPGVVTTTSHGYTSGDYLVLNVEGMSEVDARVFRVDNESVNDYELEGEDTTNYGTFSSGTAQEITFGINIATATGLTASGGDPNFIDVTTIHDNIAKQIPGLSSPISYSFDNIWDVSDAGLVAMKTASETSAQRAFRFTFSTGQIMVFNGYVTATLIPTGTAQNLVTTPTTITLFGTPTYYAS